jgi:hypothetical protein
MRIIISCVIICSSLIIGSSARAQAEAGRGNAVTDAAAPCPTAQDSLIDKWGDWYATIGKSPEESARIVDERRAQRIQAAGQAGAGLEPYVNKVKEQAGQIKEQVKEQAAAEIEAAKGKIKDSAAQLGQKAKEKVEAKVKEKVSQETEKIKNNVKAKVTARSGRLKKAMDKKTKGLFSDLMK